MYLRQKRMQINKPTAKAFTIDVHFIQIDRTIAGRKMNMDDSRAARLLLDIFLIFFQFFFFECIDTRQSA